MTRLNIQHHQWKSLWNWLILSQTIHNHITAILTGQQIDYIDLDVHWFGSWWYTLYQDLSPKHGLNHFVLICKHLNTEYTIAKFKRGWFVDVTHIVFIRFFTTLDTIILLEHVISDITIINITYSLWLIFVYICHVHHLRSIWCTSAMSWFLIVLYTKIERIRYNHLTNDQIATANSIILMNNFTFNLLELTISSSLMFSHHSVTFILKINSLCCFVCMSWKSCSFPILVISNSTVYSIINDHLLDSIDLLQTCVIKDTPLTCHFLITIGYLISPSTVHCREIYTDIIEIV